MTDSQRWMVVFGVLVACWLVYLLSPVLMPFVAATLLAYFLNPLVERLVEWHLPRLLAVSLVIVLAIIIVFGAVLFLIPVLERQIIAIVSRLPELAAWLQNIVFPWLNKHFHMHLSFNVDVVKGGLVDAIKEHGNLVGKILNTISRSGFALVAFITDVILIPVVVFYLLKDWVKVTQAFRKLLPRKEEKGIVGALHECGDVLGAFFKGQFLVMIGLGIIYSFGLWLTGLDVGVLIGVLAGILSIVPYLGFFIGIILAIIATMIQFGSWWHLIAVAAVFAVGEMAESFVLVPWLVGDRVGIHPVAIIFAVMAFGQLFGFVGVLLAVPISAVLMVFLRRLRLKYISTRYYKEG